MSFNINKPLGAPQRLGFSSIFILLLCTGVIIFAIHAIESATLGRTIRYVELPYPSARVPKSIDGYTIALVTDTHDIAKENLEAVVDRINARNVDLLLLGGDYAGANHATERSFRVLAKAKTRDGIYGVDGNHDNYQKIYPLMKDLGINILDNTGVPIKKGLYLAGVQDLWNRQPDALKAISGRQKDDFVLLLSHNPDVSMQQDMANVDLMLSGHTHGGQITFFGLWAPALNHVSKYGQLFKGGLVHTKTGVDVLVNRGTGSSLNVPRVYARPEVYFITLHAQ